ncbi:NAD-dependent epimerase/dehydratase family protein [Fimbriimonas ginsengisoli]|uniref:NAD dependent epimerase/dehydratase family n=1 Tax=Fimbriimonas ginsengisoli Gsoil 348 TaxID=661478 RepID=A0A068NMR3_FIMGI|nr:NAD(P)-dependent oxidoreductase [Fimbriimonas ginsengisoli]AIE84751.1 NAD dependent epimerase/dehydratase family [Fimbriimonas ginsengisoli Gsoil 348]
MKVFVTGGMGFIGSHIVVELVGRGDEVTILARNRRKIPSFLETRGVSIVEGDLQEYELVRSALKGHDACIHNAICWDEEPTELQLKDTRAAANVFESAAEAGVAHLIYTSSTAVHRPFRPAMDETQRLTPTDFYGATKAAGEAFLSAFSYQSEMRCNTIRPGPTVGVPVAEGAPVNCDRRFREIVDAVIRGEEIVVAKHDGRQFIAATDLAKLYAAVLHSEANREVYVAVAREYTTWEEIALEAVSMVGSNRSVIAEDRGFSETPNHFDVGKIERDFGFEFSARVALRDYLRYSVSLHTQS